MKGGNFFNGNHAPSPAHTMEKTCYQGRMGVTATKTTYVAFKDSMEDGERKMAEDHSMNYTPINNREPTPQEKGHASEQSTMGGFENKFKY
jgi:hypothetical protein